MGEEKKLVFKSVTCGERRVQLTGHLSEPAGVPRLCGISPLMQQTSYTFLSQRPMLSRRSPIPPQLKSSVVILRKSDTFPQRAQRRAKKNVNQSGTAVRILHKQANRGGLKARKLSQEQHASSTQDVE